MKVEIKAVKCHRNLANQRTIRYVWTCNFANHWTIIFLKESMKKYWFKPKKYGIGFFPVSIEGWIASLVLMGLIFISAYTNNFFISGENTATCSKDGLRFLFDVVVLCCLFTALFITRLDGELKWRWGKNGPDRKNNE